MKTYANRNGRSSVRSYEYGDTYILVQFKSGAHYRYSYASAGKNNIENMKQLADLGSGLGSYIMNNCKFSYEK